MRKRLVNQHAIIGERTQETRKQRAMQIIRNEDGVEFLSLEWPRIGFQVRADRGNPGDRCESVERGRVTVNRHDAKTARSKPSAVASDAAAPESPLQAVPLFPRAPLRAANRRMPALPDGERLASRGRRNRRGLL